MKPEADAFYPIIIGVGGTARRRSSSECAVAHALHAAKALGARTILFDGEFVSRLPLYLPGERVPTPNEEIFIEAIRTCHGVIVGTPSYHGSLSGPIKNVLDLIEDTAKDRRPYLDGRAFGCVVTAAGWQGCGTTLVSLRTIAHALRAWPTPFGATLNASVPMFDVNGVCMDSKAAEQLAVVARQVVEFARCRDALRSLMPSVSDKQTA